MDPTQIQPSIRDFAHQPKSICRRSIGAKKRCSVDGIDTHCGFIFRETSSWFYSAAISHACDRAMAKRNMTWVQSLQDYILSVSA